MLSKKVIKNSALSIIIAMLVFISFLDASAQGDAPVSITGIFSIIWGDSQSGSSNIRYMLTDDKMQTTMLSLNEALAHSLGGVINLNKKYITVQGVFASPESTQNVLEILEVTSISISARSSKVFRPDNISPLVSGSKPWVSIMCKFSDYSVEPKDLNYFQEMYANTQPGMDHYWREQSFNMVDVSGSSASGWFTLPHPESYYNPSDTLGGTNLSLLANDCIAVADASVNFSNFSGINMMFNTNFDNGYAWGGSRYMTLDGTTKSWSITWEPPWGYSSICVIAHEMGHGFGLPHSSGTYGQTYDNVWDVMSDTWTNCTNSTDPTYGCLGQHTISYHKDKLGWIPAIQKYNAEGSNTITIEHLALSSTTNYKMAQIPIAGSNTHFYTVEVRQRSGYDIKLPDKAVIIHEVNTTRSRPAYVMDVDNNGNTADEGAMFKVGETFTDAANGISVNVLSSTSTGFQVSIIATNIPDSFPWTMFMPAILSAVNNQNSELGASCASGKVYDCVMKCVDSSTAQSWIGDGICDDGTSGIDLRCPAFLNDGVECN